MTAKYGTDRDWQERAFTRARRTRRWRVATDVRAIKRKNVKEALFIFIDVKVQT